MAKQAIHQISQEQSFHKQKMENSRNKSIQAQRKEQFWSQAELGSNASSTTSQLCSINLGPTTHITSETQFPHVKNGENNTYLTGLS